MKNVKRIITSSIFGIFFVLMIFCGIKGVNAQSNLSAASTLSYFSQNPIGEGTEESPFLISTKDHLHGLSNDVNNGVSYNNKLAAEYSYKLICDIDFGGEEFTPIGSSSKPFKGTFDGDGCKISNVNFLNITSDTQVYLIEYYSGFFGFANKALIENIVFDNAIIQSENLYNCVGIVGAYITSSTVDNCVILKSCFIGVKGLYVGGVCGYFVADRYGNPCVVSNCINNCSFSIIAPNSSSSGQFNVGGIIGFFQDKDCDDDCLIINCFNFGDINCIDYMKTSVYMGGIVGYFDCGKISLCGNNGKISGCARNECIVAGIAGRFYGEVNDCCNYGDIFIEKRSIANNGTYACGIIGKYSGTWSNLNVYRSYNMGNIEIGYNEAYDAPKTSTYQGTTKVITTTGQTVEVSYSCTSTNYSYHRNAYGIAGSGRTYDCYDGSNLNLYNFANHTDGVMTLKVNGISKSFNLKICTDLKAEISLNPYRSYYLKDNYDYSEYSMDPSSIIFNLGGNLGAITVKLERLKYNEVALIAVGSKNTTIKSFTCGYDAIPSGTSCETYEELLQRLNEGCPDTYMMGVDGYPVLKSLQWDNYASID